MVVTVPGRPQEIQKVQSGKCIKLRQDMVSLSYYMQGKKLIMNAYFKNQVLKHHLHPVHQSVERVMYVCITIQ